MHSFNLISLLGQDYEWHNQMRGYKAITIIVKRMDKAVHRVVSNKRLKAIINRMEMIALKKSMILKSYEL